MAPAPLRIPFSVEAAHKKGAGSTKNGRDSQSKRRGIKVYGGQPVRAGGIIFRQTGSTWYPGQNVDVGKDYTVFSLIDGIVIFDKNKYSHSRIHVFPHDHEKSVALVTKTHTKEPKEGVPSRAERRRAAYVPRRQLRQAGAAPAHQELSIATVTAAVTP